MIKTWPGYVDYFQGNAESAIPENNVAIFHMVPDALDS